MALSQDVVSQFSKLVNNKEKDNGATIKGTYKQIDGVDYVQLDGSDILTPVDMLVDAENNERVKVEVKDHAATVIGNITSPGASSKDLKDVSGKVDEYGNTITQMETTITQMNSSITQLDTHIQQVDTTIQQVDTVVRQQKTVIDQLGVTVEQHNVDITQMNTTISQHGDDIKSMNNTIYEHNNHLILIDENIKAQGDTILSQGNSITEIGNKVNVQGSNIEILNSAFTIKDGVLKGLSSIITDELHTKYAEIDFANIGEAAIQKLFVEHGLIKDLVVENGHITGELIGVTIKGDLIEGNTIVADKLVVRGSDGLYYKLNTEGLNELGLEKASKFDTLTEKPEDWNEKYSQYYEIIDDKYTHITSETAPEFQSDKYYKLTSTYETGLDGSNIVAKTITADRITVDDLVAFDATIGGFQITDKSINSIGKDNIDAPTNGLYMDKEGQLYFGDSDNHVKYYKEYPDDPDSNYILDIRAANLFFGTSDTTVGESIEAQEEKNTQMSNDIETNSSLIERTSATLRAFQSGITSTIKSLGGNNLLRNSVGLAGLDFWEYSGDVKPIQDSIIEQNTVSGSCFRLTGGARLKQSFITQPGTLYGVSFKLRHIVKGTNNPIYIRIHRTDDDFDEVLAEINETFNEYTLFNTYTYVASVTNPYIEILTIGDDVVEISDLIVSLGENQGWSGYFDEVYGKEHRLDKYGLKLTDLASKNFSYMTSTSMLFNQGGKITAQLNPTVISTQNAEFEDSCRIGPLKVVPLDNENVVEYVI